MSEAEHRRQYRLTFQIVETTLKRTNHTSIYIGNSGGQYEYTEGDLFFQQHFAPDGSWDPADFSLDQRKHASLYPAVLWEFLRWQEELPDTDPRKFVKIIKGTTNRIMSDFRQKLLGTAYTFHREENEQDSTKPKFVYEINIPKLKETEGLFQKLKRFSSRAKQSNYSMMTQVPASGEILSIMIPAMIGEDTPFVPGLIPMSDITEGEFSKVYMYPPGKGWVVKQVTNLVDSIQADWLEYKKSDSPPKITFDRFRDTVLRDSKLLKMSMSGIREFIPDFSPIWGQNNGEPAGFIAIKKVIGKDIISVDSWKPEHTQMMEDFLIACLNFFEETKNTSIDKVGRFPDILEVREDGSSKMKNIMFGKLEDEDATTKDKLFYIDTYPLFPVISDKSEFFDHLKGALRSFEVKINSKFSAEFWEILSELYGTSTRS